MVGVTPGTSNEKVMHTIPGSTKIKDHRADEEYLTISLLKRGRSVDDDDETVLVHDAR